MTSETTMPSSTVPASASREFLLSWHEVQARQSYKWRQYPAGVIAACVADMDFRTSPEVQAAIQHSVSASDYSYPLRGGRRADESVARAFSDRMENLYGWHVDPGQTLVLADLVQAVFATVLAFSGHGDEVILQVPNYPPFREAIEHTGRKLVPLMMESTADSYVFDLDKLEDVIGPRTRIFLLCNPQNPTGRVFTRAELEKVVAFAEKHDLLILSDEIHCDLIYPGTRHIPVASLSPSAAARTITLNSATKSFNIPGLRCGVASFGSMALRERFHRRIPQRLTGSVNNLGIDATVAAWTSDPNWLDAVRDHLLTMRDHATDVLQHALPGVRFHVPEATYLMWLDCTGLRLPGSAFEFFLKQARIGFGAGESYDPAATNFVRMNFATSKEILDQILDRMIGAVRQRVA